ncbi:flavin reductase family protein [Streptomyces malaysiensis]|uniref:Flavin reductase-like, FMN-binding protein n=1 Tax=Streptomyces malaysiensis TaxID=92644 RepID=A0A7X6B0T2_STRMQ|nr:flavin reductase family protein [Streptomyces malaysiensis]NIY69443.1 flavin reductase-like, FMN-binding protein [Streptomyces malaysiensis]
MTSTQPDVSPAVLREVCGRWATGVAIVTGNGIDGMPLGMAVNSFTSVSLDPPLVLFCSALTSSTWPRIKQGSRFAVNILAESQSDLARSFARSGGDKFAGVALRSAPDGLPALAGAIARLVCRIEDVHPGGDHEVVVGRVLATELFDGDPLLFHRGKTAGMALPVS